MEVGTSPRHHGSGHAAADSAKPAEPLDVLGIECRGSKRDALSVARREAVARLDEFVGPKY
jgi:hypothetical protein